MMLKVNRFELLRKLKLSSITDFYKHVAVYGTASDLDHIDIVNQTPESK